MSFGIFVKFLEIRGLKYSIIKAVWGVKALQSIAEEK